MTHAVLVRLSPALLVLALVSVPDSREPRASDAEVLGSVESTIVTGTIIRADGTPFATFEGSVSGNAVNGTYRTPQGYTGTWSWDGPLTTP